MRAVRFAGSFQPYFQQVVHWDGLSVPRCSLQYEGSGPRAVVMVACPLRPLRADHVELVIMGDGPRAGRRRCPVRLRRPPGAALLERPAGVSAAAAVTDVFRVLTVVRPARPAGG